MSATTQHPSFVRRCRRAARRWLWLTAACLACETSPPAPPSDAGPGLPAELAQASAWLAPEAVLPARAEVVQLAHAVAVLASKELAPGDQARLYRLAADLRLRVFRLDHEEADAREALALLGEAARAGRGHELGCEAERARAQLLGELAGDAATQYKELYLAKRRLGAPAAATSTCALAIERDLALASGFRPSGADLWALEREGDRAAEGAMPKASAASSGAASASASGPKPGADLVVAPVDLAPSKEPVKVTKIEKYGADASGRVVIHVSGATSFQVGALAPESGKDARIYLDIDRASVKSVAREIEVGGAIKRVRTAPREGGSRIVLDLAAEMQRKVFYLPEPFRIVVDVGSRKPTAQPASGKRTVKRVALDPGHGGHDAGAVGPTGLKEKDVALEIAHLVAPVLATELSIETMLTRDKDVFVPLDERTARANAFHADLFVSIHCNASESGDARGIEVFILDELKDVNRATARIAALENGLSLNKALDAGALDAEMARIAGRLASGEVADSSRRLAALLGKATLASLAERYPNTPDHGLKSAGFYVLAGAEMPAVLFETSFISNAEDEARLAKADFRQKIADGIVNAVRAYRDGK